MLRQTARKDHRAFAELMRRHQDRVYRLALKLLKDRLEAEDATQEVFLRAYEHAGRFQPTGTVAAWLNRITANHCLNLLRSRSPRSALALDNQEPAFLEAASAASLRSAFPTPLESLEERDLAHRLQQALDALPENQRQALILKRFGDFSYREIADFLGLSAAAVDGLIKRARNNLKKALAEFF